MILNKDNINSLLAKDIDSWRENGYVIRQINTIMYGLISATLVNTKTHDRVELTVVSTANALNRHIELRTIINDKITSTKILYELPHHSEKFTFDLSEVNKVAKVQKARFPYSYSFEMDRNQTKINVTPKNVKFIRGIKGWKTVARKNIEVYRIPTKSRASYVLKNIKNGHETKIN